MTRLCFASSRKLNYCQGTIKGTQVKLQRAISNYAGSSTALLTKQLHFEARAREFISTFDALARCASNFIKMKLQNIPT